MLFPSNHQKIGLERLDIRQKVKLQLDRTFVKLSFKFLPSEMYARMKTAKIDFIKTAVSEQIYSVAIFVSIMIDQRYF